MKILCQSSVIVGGVSILQVIINLCPPRWPLFFLACFFLCILNFSECHKWIKGELSEQEEEIATPTKENDGEEVSCFFLHNLNIEIMSKWDMWILITACSLLLVTFIRYFSSIFDSRKIRKSPHKVWGIITFKSKNNWQKMIQIRFIMINVKEHILAQHLVSTDYQNCFSLV